jgi:transcriptional regulator with XRE-family HTH domain
MANPADETFGNRLVRLREDAGVKQAELAARIGSSQSTVSQLEKDQRKPSFDMIRKLADALGVSPAYLLGAEVEELRPEERQHFRQYRSLPEKAQQELRAFTEYLRQKHRGSSEETD